MKLNRIEIVNVLGLARAEIDLPTPVTLISGPNMSGKSSLRDAVSMALLGTPARVTAKKDLGELLHDGAKKGRIMVATGEKQARFSLPKGEHQVDDELAGDIPGGGAQFLPYLLDPSRFMSASLDDRKRTLFDLSGCKPSMKLIEPMLQKDGVDMTLFAEVAPMLRAGFPEVSKAAADRAREAKGEWRGITGENWGSDKADGWEADVPAADVTQEQVDAARRDLDETLQKIADGHHFVGQIEEQIKTLESRASLLEELGEKAYSLERRQEKLAATEKDLAEWEKKFEQLTGQLAEARASENACECPSCGASLRMEAGKLVSAKASNGGVKVSDIEAELKKASDARQLLARTRQNDQASVAEAEAAAARLVEAREQHGVAVDTTKLDAAREALQKLGVQRDQRSAAHEALKDALAASESAAGTAAKAAAAHKRVLAWLAIAEEMGPDGIPAKLLARALDPINQALELLAGIAGWPKVRITKDIEVTSNERRYALTSESEKWRVDALLGLAIAQMSGLRLVILDRFDVLQNSARQELLGMLCELARMQAIDTAIICGTMKEMPPAEALPAEVTGIWIANNIAENAAH